MAGAAVQVLQQLMGGSLNLAQAATDYRALVCVFLFGGNDANNMLIPNDTAGYANYLNYRGAVASGGLGLAPGGRGRAG